MHFKRLRLQGFKSFVEPTDLLIEPGMTGIVGPNGCGKSNLVEALRWVMGETSAKRMRGSEMDDVIFGGTTTRPSRNLAEVSLTLDNNARTAPAEYNDSEELLVLRQIERGSGSNYRLNGKPVRQRDVQLLFADQSTGAHSTSVVGQGQIDALIRAKPQDRRQILEEASGTAGLQARRHEAELKLKGAEQNLTRVDDVLHTLDTQLRSLKTQVRQASRYRNLAEHIRRTESTLLKLRWQEAETNAENVKNALFEAERQVNELLAVVTQETTKRTEIAAELPALRQAEAAAAAVVQKLILTRDQIENETRRINNDITAQEQLLVQTKQDYDREQNRQHDGMVAITKLQEEQTALGNRTDTINTKLPEISTALESINASVAELDSCLHNILEQVAAAEAKQQSLQQQLATLSQRQATLTIKREQIDAQRTALAEEIAARPDLSLATAMVEACESELAKRQGQAQQAEQTRLSAEQTQQAKRNTAQITEAQLTRLSAEADAIKAFLTDEATSDANATAEAVIDRVTVTPGLEQALAVALGEALTASLDSAAAQYWRELPALENTQSLPGHATALSSYIQAPAALSRSLNQIGLVENQAEGESLAASLKAGQILVSRDGWAWRWDGFTVSPQAKTATAVRLQQRNRLAALQSEIAAAETAAEQARIELTEANQVQQACNELDQLARVSLQSAYRALNDAREHYAKQERETAANTAKLNSFDEALAQINGDLEQVREQAQINENERLGLPDIAALRMEIATKRTNLAEQRSQQAQRQSERDQLVREQATVTARQNAITGELTAWQERLVSAARQLEILAERITVVEAQLVELRAKPAELTARYETLLNELQTAEANRKEAADILITTEQQLNSVEQQLRQYEKAASDARENRVRAEAAVEAASEHFSVLRERIAEKLNCTPEELAQASENAATAEEVQSVSELEQMLGRYQRERDNMGPVNLRAEVESETVQGEIDKLTQEKDDLSAAIAKLRQGISQLNKEARERLQQAFTLVNERFQTLFARLFNGGKAHLELIDNEDPMNAGLEIFAAPPGKKTQVLSLLSGGERTLTALALLFAVFQTNPSPICVLDEAEAALDESNIGRFCNLVEDIARETGTRFLIITHQRLTMARMDRLYGVTMSEKGVSQLVSVDLTSAVAIRDGELPHQTSETNAENALAAVQAA